MTGLHIHLAELRRPLQRLRRDVTWWLMLDGLRRVLFWALVLLGVSFFLDWQFRFDGAQRLFLLVVIALVLAGVMVWRLIWPLTVRLDDDTLAGRLERADPNLKERYFAALQFSRLSPEQLEHVSAAMVREAVEQGRAAARSLDSSHAIDRKSMRGNLLAVSSLGGVLLLLGFGVVFNQALGIWFNRNVLLGNAKWPQDTYLQIIGLDDSNRLVVPRGDDWTLNVRADGIVPPTVRVDIDPRERGERRTEQMVQGSSGRFHTVFQSVIDPFRFRVRGGDDVSPWIEVELVDRPEVATLDLTLTPPGYVGRGAVALPADQGPYDALPGSRLVIEGEASKPLRMASLEHDGQTWTTSFDEPTERFRFEVSGEELTAGIYGISLLDASPGPGLASRRPARFTMRIQPDEPPTVNAELAGVGNLVLQQARIPIRGTLRDDFAVTGAELAYRWRTTPDAEPTETMRKPVAGWDAQGSASGERSSFEAELDLQNVEIPLESSLQLMVEATDNDDVSGPKVGRSAAMFVKIVDEDQFRQDLTRREQEQRRELERLMKQQRDLQTETRILLAAFDEPDADPDALRRGLLASQRTQRQIGEGSAGVARQFEQMVAEVLNNRLEDSTGGTVQRYQNQVIDELAIVAEAQSPAVVDLQERARRSWSEPADRDAALRSAAEAQLEIAAALERVLSNLAKAEGIAELVNLLREVMREQEQVKTATADKREEAIDDVFED